jgi:tyrosine-protein kinase Etk/Wzc
MRWMRQDTGTRMHFEHTESHESSDRGLGREMSLLDVLIALGRHKLRLAAWPIGAAVLAAAVTFALPRTYTAETRIFPPQQGQSAAAAMLSQFGGLAGAAGGALGIKNPSDLYVAMLKSHAVADALIARFELKTLYKAKYVDDARSRLATATRISTEKEGLITVEFDARDPKLAASIANAYVEELHNLTKALAVTEAGQRRVFFERQLQQAKERLVNTEFTLRQAIDTGGLVSVDAQGRAAVELTAKLRAQATAREVEIGAMQAYATTENPELRRTQRELASLRQQLARLESGTVSGGFKSADAGVNSEAPTGLANVRLLRDLKYDETLFEVLAKQYELARIDEAKEAPLIQVLDKAQVPERPSKPRKRTIVLMTFIGGMFAAVLATVGQFVVEVAASDPTQRATMAAVKSAWFRRNS